MDLPSPDIQEIFRKYEFFCLHNFSREFFRSRIATGIRIFPDYVEINAFCIIMPLKKSKKRRGRGDSDHIVDRVSKLRDNHKEELPADRLPNASDILSYYFFLSSTATVFNTVNFGGVAQFIAEELRSVWQKCLPGIPMISER